MKTFHADIFVRYMNQLFSQLKYHSVPFIIIAISLLVVHVSCGPTLAGMPDKSGLSPGSYDRFTEHMKLGLKFNHDNDYKHALPHWQSIVNDDPNNIVGLQNLACALDRVGDLHGSLAVSDRILQLNPADGGTLLTRTVIFDKLHQHEKALQASRIMNKIEFTGDTLSALGSIHGPGDYELAFKRLGKQISRTPKNPDLYLTMCTLYSQLGRQTEAAEAADRCANYSPKYCWVWRTAKVKEAAAELAMLQDQAALRLLDESLANLQFGKSKPPDTASLVLEEALLTRAQVYDTQKKYKEALAALTLLVDNHFPDPAFFVNRAATYLEMNDSAHALTDLGKAIFVSPSHNTAYVKRSALLTSLKRYKEAIQDVNKLVEMSPSDEMFLLQRAKLYGLDGDCKRRSTITLEQSKFHPMKTASIRAERRCIESLDKIKKPMPTRKPLRECPIDTCTGFD